MKRKFRFKKLVAGFLAFSLTFSSITLPSFAEDSNQESSTSSSKIVSSIGSDESDVDTTQVIGIDSVQDKQTEYSEEISEETTSTTNVYVTQAPTFMVAIPKTLILDGVEQSCTYVAGVKGDLTGKGYVYIIAQPSMWLYDIHGIKKPIKALIKQDNKMFVSSDLSTVPADAVNGVNDDTFVYTHGSISTTDMTAGSWTGQFNFTIAAFEDFENPEAIATDGTILKLNADTMYIGADYKGAKPSNVTVNGNSTEDLTIASVDRNLFDVLTFTQTVTADVKSTDIVWESSNPNILVDSNGRVSLSKNAIAGDTATITATYVGTTSNVPGEIDRDEISISFEVVVFDIILSTNEIELNVGEQDQLEAAIYPDFVDLDVNWTKPKMMDGVNFDSTQDSNVSNMTINVSQNAIDDNSGELIASVEDYSQSCRIVVLAKHEHTYVVTATGAADCENMGFIEYTCNTCDASEEGHSYRVNEPALGHDSNDGHWCARCDKLIIPFKIGELTTKKVAGKQMNFVCVDDSYVDASGQKAALFMSSEAIKGVKYNTANNSSWKDSIARKTINTNSDTTHVMLTDTTIQESATGAIASAYFGLSNWTFASYKPDPQTLDYFFIPSIRELCTYQKYVWNPWGEAPSESYWQRNFDYVWYTRTPSTQCSTGKAANGINFVYSDGFAITAWDVNSWHNAYATVRPCYCVAQDVEKISSSENGVWDEGEVTYKKVAGKNLKFVCVDPEYKDATGAVKGALFLSTELIGANDCIYSKDSNVWAYSQARQYLNGNDSDKSNVVLVDTTVRKQGANGVESWLGVYQHELGITDLSGQVSTQDYFFELSLEEMFRYQKYMLSSDGQIKDMNKCWSSDKYGFYLRTPKTGTTDVTYYVQSDAKYYNYSCSKQVYNTTIGLRPAFVLPN